MFGVQVAEHQVRVGNGGIRAPLAVTGRTGNSRRAFRPDLDGAHGRAVRDAAAVGADLDQVDYRYSHRNSATRLETMNMSHFNRSEEHTSEIQPIIRKSYDDFCLKKK